MDLRVKKTQLAIQQAFIELLNQKPFEKIVIQDILDRALINRTTFYNHYSGKNDLTSKMIAEFNQEYQQFLDKRFNDQTDFLQFIQTIEPKIHNYRKTVLALWKINTPRHHLYQDMHKLIKSYFLQFAQQQTGQLDLDFQAETVATLLLSAIKYFFERDQNIPAEWMLNEMKKMILLITP